MWPVSAAFLAEMAHGSQDVVTRADVLYGGVVKASGLIVTGGNVNVDVTASPSRRRCTATVVDPTGALIPNDASDVLSPYGYELRLWRGYLVASTGVTELAPLCTCRLSEAKVEDSGAPTIGLSGFDRARSVNRYRFEVPYVVPAGTNYITAIQDLISSRLPGVTFSAPTTPMTTPLLVFDQMADPWKAASDMAASIGCEVFFDAMGVCVIRTVPNPATDPVTYTYSEGGNAVLLSVTNTLTDDPGYNGAVVDGQPAGLPPVHSVTYDMDATSPTNSLTAYGKVPEFFKSQYIVTQAQADEAAAAMLRRNKGGTEQVSFTAIPNPAHEGGDLVSVVRAGIGVNSICLLESFAIPLAASASMTATTRKRRTA